MLTNMDTTPFLVAVNAFNALRQIPGVISASSSGVQMQDELMATIAPTHLWEIKERFTPEYPYEAYVMVEGVKFFTILSMEEAIRYGVCPIPPGEPELPEPTLEEMVIC